MEKNLAHTDAGDIEYDLKYSRLLAALEHKGLRALQTSKILIVGMRGLGIEIAKNLVMMGVSQLYIQDDRVIRSSDLSTSILFNDDNVGKNIADTLVFRLSEINKDVRVQIHNENSFSGFSLVCLTETKSEDDINNINAQCRANRTPLVIGETFGVFGFVFNDFGEEFKVSNANKEDFMSSYDNLGLQLNKTMQFAPFSQLLSNKLTPQKVTCQDNTKAHNFVPLLRSLINFRVKHGRGPIPWNSEEARIIVEQANEFDNDLDENLVSRLAQVSSIDFAPMISVIGGMMTHEIVKAVTRYGCPVDQFMFYECSDVLPEVPPMLEPETSLGSRYDNLAFMLGYNSAKQIQQSKVLLTGAGSVGCEVLKNLTVLKVAAGSGGEILVADKGKVNASHMCSQMLYRSTDVGKSKADLAVERIKQLSSVKSNITPWVTKLDSREKEEFSRYDVVINASPHRHDIDEMIVLFQKPMIDCGISSTKGHVEVVYPHLTTSINSQRDPPLHEAPFDALYKWPRLFRHCVTWAKDLMFHRNFCSDMEFMQKIFQPPKYTLPDATDTKFAYDLMAGLPRDTEGCMEWALRDFNGRFYRTLIRRLQDPAPNLFPPSSRPKPFSFDINDPLHVTYVLTAARLIAQAVGLEPTATPLSRKLLEDVLKGYNDAGSEVFVPPNPSKGQLEQLVNEIVTHPVVFTAINHDVDDKREHLIMIHTAAVLWARAFGIPEQHEVHTLMLTNNRNPKIVSTSSIIAGLATIEFIKLRTKTNIECSTFRNSFINTFVPTIVQSHPISPPVKHFLHMTFTLWDKIEIDEGDLTFEQLLNCFKQKYHLDVLMIGAHDLMIYSYFAPTQIRLIQKVSEYVMRATKITNTNYVELDLVVNEPDGVGITLPRLVYRWRNSFQPCETWMQ